MKLTSSLLAASAVSATTSTWQDQLSALKDGCINMIASHGFDSAHPLQTRVQWIQKWTNKCERQHARLGKIFQRFSCGQANPSYIVEFNVDLTANLCGGVAEHADQQIDWASAILTGVSCPATRIAKINTRQKRWETRFKKKLNCPSTDFYWWTWTGSEPIEVAPDSEPVIAVGDSVRISTVCNPNFIDGWGDGCEEYDSEGWCTDVDQWFFVESMVYDATEQSYQ